MQQLNSFQHHIYQTASQTHGTAARIAASYQIQPESTAPAHEQAQAQLQAQVSQCIESLFQDHFSQGHLRIRWQAKTATPAQTLGNGCTEQEIELCIITQPSTQSSTQPSTQLLVSLPGWCGDAQSLTIIGNALDEYLSNGVLLDGLAYRKYAHWQQSNLDPDDCIFWHNYLSATRESHPLPFTTRHNGQTAIESTDISLDLNTIPAAMRQPAMLQALWYGLFSRLSLDASSSLGVVAQSRVLPQFDTSLGLYALVVPVTLTLQPTDKLQQIAEQLTDYLEQNIDAQISVPPNERWDQAPAHSFQVLTLDHPSASTVKTQDIWQHVGTFDSQCLCLISANQLTIRMFYSRAHYAKEAMDQLLDIYQTLLCSSTPDTTILATPLLTPTQHQQPIVADEAQPDDSAKTVIEHIHQWTQTNPNDIAIEQASAEQEKASCTYAALAQHSLAICAGLQATKYQAPKRVAVVMENSIALVQSVYALLRLGHAIVPVDPTQITAREQFILSECDFALVDAVGAQVLAQPDITLTAFDYATLVATIVTDTDAVAASLPTVESATIASVIYTSGTTGRPKGTLVSHGNLISYLTAVKTKYLQHTKRALVHTPISFDMAHTSFFLPLIAGGTVEMVRTDNSLEALVEALDRQTTPVLLKLTPSHIRAMKPWLEQIHTTFDNLAVAVIGGEQLYSTDLRLMLQKMPNLQVFNEYGPTETTVGVTTYELSINDIGPVPIGKPLPHAKLFVLDPQGYPLAPGMIGELFIAGPSVAQGYLNQAQLSATRFIDAPAALNYSGKLYKTGDLVTVSALNGQLRFIKRNDAQLKVRGYRIEKEEIINCLSALDGVQSAALIVIEQDNTSQLVAFVVGPQATAADALKQQLQQQLPSYMQPNRLHILPALPLTANGKIDETALEAHSIEASKTRNNSLVPPSTPLEVELIAIWQAALDVEEIGITDNFFDVGGDSIRAIYIASTAKAQGYSLKVQDIMQHPTIAELAPVIAASSTSVDALETLSDEELTATIDAMDIDDVDQLLGQLE